VANVLSPMEPLRISAYTLLVRERSALADPYCHIAWNSVGLLVHERSALADPYCQSTWNSVCGCVCLFVRNFEVKYLENQRC